MKIILSRKGFDSSFGGVASPVFTQDGKFLSLPIPLNSPEAERLGYDVSYNDLNLHGHNYGHLVQDLSRNKRRNQLSGDMLVRLGLDLLKDVYPKRDKAWRPLLGQLGSAQGHLKKQGIGTGDIFLFFGLYNWVKKENGLYSYEKGEKPFHLLWGWFQVEDVIDLDRPGDKIQDWMSHHPYFYMPGVKGKALYLGSRDLVIDEKVIIKGGGVGIYDKYREDLRLSRQGSGKCTDWLVPTFMYSEDKTKLPTYHQDPGRWTKEGDRCGLKAVSIGQEFVFESEDHPGAIDWIVSLIGRGMS
ncbi:MAG: hypothetical protein LHW56_10250 [Candidatus Cloacimonetes bacterium]|nr:hypothetical protein [Candidatus Cloacimonadota bacterium]MDY0173273.1 hypothetical protein [Candidatus Cloacimonadaceae bacterium]